MVFVSSIFNFFIYKIALANKWMRKIILSRSNSALFAVRFMIWHVSDHVLLDHFRSIVENIAFKIPEGKSCETIAKRQKGIDGSMPVMDRSRYFYANFLTCMYCKIIHVCIWTLDELLMYRYCRYQKGPRVPPGIM